MLQNIETRDFYLAAYLISKGIKLQTHQKIKGTTIFNFANDQDTTETIDLYYSMRGMIEPMLYGNSIKALKTIIHSYDTTRADTKENNYVQQNRSKSTF